MIVKIFESKKNHLLKRWFTYRFSSCFKRSAS
jgi:hypothetical protein